MVQGFGNVGAAAARRLWREGCVIVAVSDVKGGIYSDGGLDVAPGQAHAAETGSVAGFPAASP